MADVARLDWIARLGFFARAVVYILLGWIALNTRSKADEGQNAVFEMLRDMPAGTALLVIVAVGLCAYGLFRLFSAFLDLDREGQDWKGIGKRFAQFFSGVAHILLGYTAYTYTSDLQQSQGGDDRSRQAAQTILDLPLGPVLLGVIGLYFLITAGSQAFKAVKASFMDEIAPDAPHATRILGRIGHAARAVVFAIIGWSLINAAWFEEGHRAHAIGGALTTLRQSDTLYVLVAAGLILFGLFSLILARYRILPRIDVRDAARAAATAPLRSRPR